MSATHGDSEGVFAGVHGQLRGGCQAGQGEGVKVEPEVADAGVDLVDGVRLGHGVGERAGVAGVLQVGRVLVDVRRGRSVQDEDAAHAEAGM